MKKVFTIFTVVILFSQLNFAQVSDRFNLLSKTDVEGYAKPFATSIGLAMNTGGFRSADVSKIFGFSLSIIGMMITIPDDQLTFTPALPEGYNSSEGTATIFGNHGGVYAGGNGFIIYPPGINESTVYAVFPQISGSILGTEVMVRYIPELDIGESKLSFWGVGLKHNISQYIPLIPVDIAVQALYNNFTITKIIDVKNIGVNVHASKSFGLFSVYGGLQYENSKLSLDYDLKGDPLSGNPDLRTDKKISAEIEGKNVFRAILGVSLKLLVFRLNVDYGMSSQSILSSGLSFEF